MGLIIAYCLWSTYATVSHPDPQMAELTELLGGDMDELVLSLTLTVYTVAIALTAVFQGLNARYYFRRVVMIEEYLSNTPDWVRELQESARLT
jgi:predicted MFS family arabinose efflux permease